MLDLNVVNSSSKEIRYGNHLLHYQIFLLENNFEDAKKHLEQAMSLIKSKKRIEDRDQHNYVIGIVNLIEIAFVNREVNEMKRLLEELSEIEERFGNRSLVNPLLKVYQPLFRLHHSILSGNLSIANPIKQLIVAINNEHTTKGDKSYLCLTCATYFWIIGERNKSLDYILKFKDFQNESSNFYAFRFLELIIYFELKEFNLLDSKTRSLYRYLSERDQYNRMEKALMNTLKKGIHAKDKHETETYLKELFQFLKNNQPSSSVYSLRYIYFEEWAESIFLKISIQELLANRYK